MEVTMRRLAPILAVLLLLIIGLAIYFGNRRQTTTTPYTPGTSQINQNENSTQQTSPNTVDITGSTFSPQNLIIKKGTSVIWTNHDTIAHTVTESDDQTGPQSPSLAKNQTYSFTYTETGTYAYKCSLHPSMTGTITVTE